MNKKWFIRQHQDHVDPIYLDNMRRATKYFIRWLTSGSLPFDKMLVDMHKIVSSDYSGYTSTNNQQIYVVRSEFRGEVANAWYPILKKEWYDGVTQHPIIRPKIKYVPIDTSHWLGNTEPGYVLHLPHEKHVRFYLTLMEELMTELREEGMCLVTLANYIHLFVIGHPFEKINFSICMAQVNALLDMHGYEPIYHGYLDFKCFVYNYDVIEKLFVDMIKPKT